MTAPPSPALAALERAGAVPDALRLFDRAASAGRGAAPDFFEVSACVGDRVDPFRATYYFDVGRHGIDCAASANARFVAACEASDIELPAAFAELLSTDALAAPTVLQLVLGIDARDDPTATRIKYYVIFRGDSTEIFTSFAAATGIELPAVVDPGTVYIAGVDLTAGRVTDLKAYVRLRDDRIASTLRRPALHRELLAGCRGVVFQQCATSARRQMYFHASNPAAIEHELTGATNRAAATPFLRERIAAMNAGADRPLDPWILAYRYDRGELDRTSYTVYFHFRGA